MGADQDGHGATVGAVFMACADEEGTAVLGIAPGTGSPLLGEFRRLSKASGGQPLSPREREVLQLVTRGHSYKSIGERLFIAEKTVENHVRNILAKLHLSRRHELVRYALEHGIE